MPGNNSANPAMDERQAAKRLGVSVFTMRAWRFQRRGPVYAKLGRRIVYDQHDLDAYLNSCRIMPDNAA